MKILLPIDGSTPALAALHHALRLLQEGLNAEFLLANVQEPATFYEMLTTRDPEVIKRASAEAGLHLLEPAAALCRTAGVAFELEVALGDPANTLNEIVDRFQCDAIFMGARGHGAVSSALLGSVSQQVTHDARVPVTIVKDRETSMQDEGQPALWPMDDAQQV
ncbi:MAG: universal stress protein [Burkholderiales bacterium]